MFMLCNIKYVLLYDVLFVRVNLIQDLDTRYLGRYTSHFAYQVVGGGKSK